MSEGAVDLDVDETGGDDEPVNVDHLGVAGGLADEPSLEMELGGLEIGVGDETASPECGHPGSVGAGAAGIN
jgi:hypothetical protein